jgi:hypothetical protein
MLYSLCMAHISEDACSVCYRPRQFGTFVLAGSGCPYYHSSRFRSVNHRQTVDIMIRPAGSTLFFKVEDAHRKWGREQAQHSGEPLWRAISKALDVIWLMHVPYLRRYLLYLLLS